MGKKLHSPWLVVWLVLAVLIHRFLYHFFDHVAAVWGRVARVCASKKSDELSFSPIMLADCNDVCKKEKSTSGWLLLGWGIHGFVCPGWWDGVVQAVWADWMVSCVGWLERLFCSACWKSLGMWLHGFSKVVDCGDCTPFELARGLQC